MSKQALKRVRRALGLPVNREPLPAWAWPGGYPLLYLFTDGGVCCPKCANKNILDIDGAIKDRRGYLAHVRCGDWALCGVEPNHEEPQPCDNCGAMIEAAYVQEEAAK